MIRRTITIAALIAAVALAGCFDKHRLAGKWESADTSMTVEFLRNGDALWEQPLGLVKGTWEVVEGQRVKIAFTGFAGLMGPQYCGYAFDKGVLVLSGDCILAEHYTRVRS